MIDLFERNFDADLRKPPKTELAAQAEAEASLKLRLEEARQEGFDAGRRIGKQDAQEAIETADTKEKQQLFSDILEKIAELTATDAKQAQASERDIVELFLGIGERLVPELLETHGVDLAIWRVKQCIEQARTSPVLLIRACPDVIGVLEREAPHWLNASTHGTRVDFEVDDKSDPGSVKIHWQGGRLEYDLKAACTTMLEALTAAAEKFDTAKREAR